MSGESATRASGWGPLIKFILVLVLLVTVGYTISHAVARHGADALLVRHCINDDGPMQVWFRPSDNHWANLCQVGDGVFGLQIINETGDEITAFVKNKMRSIVDVERYLANRGYIRAQ